MPSSIFLEPAFFVGFAACFVLIAIALLLFLMFAPLHPAESEPAHERDERDVIRFSRAKRGRQDKVGARDWRPSAWDEQNNCPRGPR